MRNRYEHDFQRSADPGSLVHRPNLHRRIRFSQKLRRTETTATINQAWIYHHRDAAGCHFPAPDPGQEKFNSRLVSPTEENPISRSVLR